MSVGLKLYEKWFIDKNKLFDSAFGYEVIYYESKEIKTGGLTFK